MPFEGIGASVRRKEDARFLSGRGNYTDDINRPGQLYAFIRRSDRPHAKINTAATVSMVLIFAFIRRPDRPRNEPSPGLQAPAGRTRNRLTLRQKIPQRFRPQRKVCR